MPEKAAAAGVLLYISIDFNTLDVRYATNVGGFHPDKEWTSNGTPKRTQNLSRAIATTTAQGVLASLSPSGHMAARIKNRKRKMQCESHKSLSYLESV